MSFVKFSVQVSVNVRRDGRRYVASCPPLDVVSQGDSEHKALENLTEAIQLFITTCFEIGTLHTVLTQSGFIRVDKPRASRTEQERTLDVPLPLLVAQHLKQHGENRAH